MSTTNSYPFVVDESIESRLDSDTLHAIGRNVWPVDCQSCGRALGAEPPALVVFDIGGIVAGANLHHQRCHRPEWNDHGGSFILGNFLSYRTFFCGIVGESRGGPKPLPFGFVNPSLEQVLLRDNGSGWEIGTMSHYRDFLGLTGLALNKPIQTAHATLAPDGTVRVVLEQTGEGWEFSTTSETLPLVRQLRGIALGVTTAYIPDQEFAGGPGFVEALNSGNIALGWIPLR
ncbi:hypothetical protein [Nocardia niigatensis]